MSSPPTFLSLPKRGGGWPVVGSAVNVQVPLEASFSFFASPSDGSRCAQAVAELRPVIYQPDRVIVPCDPASLELPPDVLFIKGSQWTYEEEWRVVRRLASCDHALGGPAGVHLWDIEPRTVARVDVGRNAADTTVEAIMAATAPGTPLQHVNVYRARLDAGGAALIFELLRQGC